MELILNLIGLALFAIGIACLTQAFIANKIQAMKDSRQWLEEANIQMHPSPSISINTLEGWKGVIAWVFILFFILFGGYLVISAGYLPLTMRPSGRTFFI